MNLYQFKNLYLCSVVLQKAPVSKFRNLFKIQDQQMLFFFVGMCFTVTWFKYSFVNFKKLEI